MIHPFIGQFEAQAEVFDAQASTDSIDDAVVKLAAWMTLASERLTQDDLTVLVSLGGLLYREGLRRRSL